jgi:hypothetical protein
MVPEMDETTVEGLRARLERAERHARWWRLLGLVALALSAFLAVLIGFARKCG